MAWDTNEVVVLALALILSTYLCAMGKFSEEVLQGLITMLVGYAVGRIFNGAQGKE